MQASHDRLVIFSERIETLHYLLKNLQDDFKLNAGDDKNTQIRIMHGGMSDQEQQEIVEQFGKPDSALRVLLCSDVAAEGINLHYQSHRLIHYDMPWSLMVFQQRNGRVDRYGQEQEPQIYYLLTSTQNTTIQGDLRILEVLQAKDEQAYQNIGDPSVFMHVHDVAEEERLTSEAMAEGQNATDFDTQYQPQTHGNSEGDELLALFMTAMETTSPTPSGTPQPTARDAIRAPLSLFKDEYRWSKAALKCLLEQGQDWQVSFEDASRHIILTAPPDLHYRLKQIPDEALPEDGRFVLTDDLAVIKDEIARSREDENAWPKQHYLWPHHPLSQWLNDRMLALFGRHTAPVLVLPQGLEDDETCFVISGLIPNRKSHALIHEWLGVRFRNGQFIGVEDFSTTLERTRLGNSLIPNRQQAVDVEALQQRLPLAIDKARAYIRQVHQRFVAGLQPRLDQQLAELEKLREHQLQQLELRFTESVQAVRKAQQTRDIEQVFSDYQVWVRDTLTTEDQPYLQVIAVLVQG
ncbi:MAG: SWF/SNF helicase family protein [Thiothrix sp.]|nr:SWF/SNF helicase family protein [Thiothrix sp.]HPQ95434.1 C-terminal helicase domain-containing protein [Thiolinea sp.]